MTEWFTQTQSIRAVAGLSPSLLEEFVTAALVAPRPSPDGPLFDAVDIARLALLCDLTENFDLEGDGLGVVMGLIDQLHVTRHHLHAMARAMEPESQELRARIGARVIGFLAV